MHAKHPLRHDCELGVSWPSPYSSQEIYFSHVESFLHQQCSSSTSVNQELLLVYSMTSPFTSEAIPAEIELVLCESELPASSIDDEHTWFLLQTIVNGGGPKDERRQLYSVITAPGTLIFWTSTAAFSGVILIPLTIAPGSLLWLDHVLSAIIFWLLCW